MYFAFLCIYLCIKLKEKVPCKDRFVFNKFRRWLDSNCGHQVVEATALPTEPHHCPQKDLFVSDFKFLNLAILGFLFFFRFVHSIYLAEFNCPGLQLDLKFRPLVWKKPLCHRIVEINLLLTSYAQLDGLALRSIL